MLAVFVSSRTGGCRAPITVSRETSPTVLYPPTVRTAAHVDVLDCAAPTAGRVDKTHNFWSASRASFTSTEPSLYCRNRLLAAPSKRWPKICSSLLSHHVASIDVTNLKGHVLMVNMKDVSFPHACYHLPTYFSRLLEPIQ